MVRGIFAILVTIYLPTTACALVLGGSNFDLLGYPSHECTKPLKPYKPFSFSSQWEVDLYNAQVDDYNWELKQYLNCIDEYIENANNDIERIKEKGQEALGDTSYLP